MALWDFGLQKCKPCLHCKCITRIRAVGLNVLTFKRVALMKILSIMILWFVFHSTNLVAAEGDPLAHFNKGNELFNRGDYDKAIAEYSKAIKARPDLIDAFYNRGLAYYKRGRYEDAIKDLSRVITVDTKDAEVFFHRGLAYLQNKDYDRAIEDYDRALLLNSRYADAYVNRGIAYARKEMLDRAIEDYNAALQFRPSDVNSYYSRAVAYFKKALQDFQKACDIGSAQACVEVKKYSEK